MSRTAISTNRPPQKCNVCGKTKLRLQKKSYQEGGTYFEYWACVSDVCDFNELRTRTPGATTTDFLQTFVEKEDPIPVPAVEPTARIESKVKPLPLHEALPALQGEHSIELFFQRFTREMMRFDGMLAAASLQRNSVCEAYLLLATIQLHNNFGDAAKRLAAFKSVDAALMRLRKTKKDLDLDTLLKAFAATMSEGKTAKKAA